MIANNISFKANPIIKKGTADLAAEATKKIKDLPDFHDYVGAKTIFPPEATKAAEKINDELLNAAKKSSQTEAADVFVNHRAATEVTEEMDEFTKLNKMYADAQDKPTIINGKEVKVGKNIDIQG